jgi:hypothetical protein
VSGPGRPTVPGRDKTGVVRLTIALPPELYGWVTTLAEAEERSVGAQIAYLIKRAKAARDEVVP